MSAADDEKPLHPSEQNTMIAPVAGESGLVPSAGPSIAPSSLFIEETNPVFGERYQIVSMLGAGGMGTVYLARDLELDEVVALKVLKKEAVSAPGALEMFRREVKLARKVTHPNVARTFDIGEAGGQKYLTMEYVEGASVARLVADSGRLSVARTVEIASAVAAGLGAAHAVGVVHRDLKPENVLVAKDGRAVITDFGVARPIEAGSATVTMGMAVGTPAYMAPEQVEARRDVDQRADIYALGVMLYELLVGDLPFTGDTALAIAAARLIQQPPDVRARRPDVPSPLANLILKCMARDRDARFANIGEVTRALASMTMPLRAVEATASGIAPASASKAIAVLPFRNAGSNEDAFVAEGLWEDLIDGLSMTRGLRVRPRASVARLAGADKEPAEVGKELGVDVIVEGSVRRMGDNIRVAARLLNVADGFQLWAKKFDRQSKDIFALSDEIASAVAEALTIEREVPERHSPTDPAAVELYLRARAAGRKMFTNSMPEAIGLFEQAIKLAPEEPTILAGYAAMQVRRWFFGFGDAFELAKNAAEKAIAAAPHLHEAQHALGLLNLHSADHAGALTKFRATARKGFIAGHESLAGLLNELDLIDEARAEIDRALAIDPLSAPATFELARHYAIRGQWEETERALARLRSVELGPLTTENSAASIRYLVWRGDIDHARTQLAATHLSNVGPLSPSILAAVLNGGDHKVVAETFFRATGSGSFRRRSLLHQIESELACLMQVQEWAIDALRSAESARLIDIGWLRRCPILAFIRDDPRFREVEARVAERTDALVRVYREG